MAFPGKHSAGVSLVRLGVSQDTCESRLVSTQRFVPHRLAAAIVWCSFSFSLSTANLTLRVGAEEPLAGDFQGQVQPLIDRYCLGCHQGPKPEGGHSFEQLSRDMTNDQARLRWHTVLRRLEAGEMPPADKPKPTAEETERLRGWIQNEIAAADQQIEREGRAVLRRLNRVEFENTIRDLLGIEMEVKDLLPVDSSTNGFDNSGAALHLSSFQMEKYLEVAEKALDLAIANSPQPPLDKRQITLKEERQVKTSTERVYRQTDDSLIMFSSSLWNSITVGQFYPPHRGWYRFRIRARGIQSAGKPVTFRIDAGPMLMGQKNHLVGYFDAAPDEPATVEWLDFYEARHSIRITPFGLANAQTVDRIGADVYEGPGLAVNWIEVEGPLHDRWPPESHRRLFGDLPQQSKPSRNLSNRVEVVSEDPRGDAQRILLSFARRAFRRAVTVEDIAPQMALVEQKLADQASFEQAVRTGLQGILVAPQFLFLDESPGPLDAHALASRLSYFLWSTMPDDELMDLADQGKLVDAEILREQVERMLQHPKAARLTENFVGQWLGLREIDLTEPDQLLYPEFDDLLKEAMVQEPQLFFNELLRQDLSVTNFVSSDFSVLNERLARHYGIPGVEGLKFRKVSLPPDCHRGGVLTMASVLKVTANGTTTSPVVRGAWVLDRLLGQPPSPPPAGVSALEPDIRGATTIREQLSKHRDIASCAACHARIDPPGFALESFDVIGGWRDRYRTRGNGEPVTIDGKLMHYSAGPTIDPSDSWPDGRTFANIDELKRLLLADPNQICRAFTVRLVTYATGQAPRASDQTEIDRIVVAVRDKHQGLRSLVHEIVQSCLFRNK